MQPRTRYTSTLAALLTVLALASMWATPAFADDSTPPPTEPVAESPDSLPEGTSLVVTNSAGDALPLASQEAANTIDIVDPMWCPTGVTPFGAGCSTSYNSLEDLTADVGTGLNPTKPGTIWVEAGPELSINPISFNKNTNAAFTTWSAFALTFQGGWSGLANKTVDPLTPSELAQSLYIEWVGAVTLKDLVITATANDVADQYALYVVGSSTISLDRVTVQDAVNSDVTAVYNGALLSTLPGGSNITINNSNFQNNEGYGLLVAARGIITTNNLTANLNGGNGATLDNELAYTDKAVVMKGLKQFNNNGGNGLFIFSKGVVSISNVVANNNGGYGAQIDNTNSAGSQGVTLLGSNSFVGNNGDGLDVFTHGAITLNNITATDNNGYGAYLDNCGASSILHGSDCLVTTAKLVKVGGVNIFSNNGISGLHVESLGAISVSNVIASNNGYTGMVLLNTFRSAALGNPNSKGTITLSGYGIFNNNSGDGLFAASYENFTAANITANFNHGLSTECGDPSWGNQANGCGVFLYIYKNVTFTGTNTFNDNDGVGLFAYNDGKTTASNVTANFNGDVGAYITSYTPGSGVTLTGVNNFNDNTGTGLLIEASGIVTLSNVTANFNGAGASIDNADDPGKPYNVTLTGSNTFNDNDGTGLEVFTFGAILINNLTANNNGQSNLSGDGAYLDNCLFTGYCNIDTNKPKPITLTGSVNANGNYNKGLYFGSIGAITMTNVTANDNGEEGANINNAFLNNIAKPQNVTFKGSNSFSGNGGTGLFITTYGAIALNNVTANWNGGDGAWLESYNGGSYMTAKTATLTGVNSFIGNALDGLYFDISGSVVLNRVNADMNGDGPATTYVGSGIYGYSDGSITLVCGHTFLNEGYGYDLRAFGGPVTIKGIYSYANLVGPGNLPTLPVSIIYPCALP